MANRFILVMSDPSRFSSIFGAAVPDHHAALSALVQNPTIANMAAMPSEGGKTAGTLAMPADLHHLALVFIAYIIGAASPGPSNMRIMAVAMTRGRASALMMAAGVISGSLFWGCMAATGVSALLAQFAGALVLLKIGGGLYLLYLAVKAVKSAATADETLARQSQANAALTGFSLYRRGLLMHIANPKALLGWVATMTLGLGSDATAGTVALILAGCAVLSVTIFGGYALMFSTEVMIGAYRRARRWIEGTLALVYGVAGIKLVLSRA